MITYTGVIPSREITTLEAWGMTDLGRVRHNNEDNWLLEPALKLAIVADGMGGASCGEIASAIVVETLADYMRRPPVNWPAAQLLEEGVREANRRVLERAGREQSCKGMGTTIVAAAWELPRIAIANVGDSRGYLWREGVLTQLTYDQTLVNELRQKFGLTQEEVSHFPHKNVLTMAVGTAPDLLIRIHEETLRPGDQVLLCSDGLSGPVDDAKIAAILGCGAPVRETVERLIEEANEAGGPDNVTAVLLRCLGN